MNKDLIKCFKKTNELKNTSGILKWIPLVTEIGIILHLDLNNCFLDSLQSLSYIQQSYSYIFKPNSGAIGRVWNNKTNEIINISKKTRFDEFHRTGIALENDIHEINITYDNLNNCIIEYLNNTNVNTKLIKYNIN